MFRALLWKEWRELWVLPAVAAPLGVASLFITKTATQTPVQMLPNSSFALSPPLSPVVWDTSFALWLLLAALYIPTHLYARERDLNTAMFLRAMPLDRFRLWWYRLLIGITAMVGVGVTLGAVIVFLKIFHQTQPEFSGYGVHIILASYCVAAILFSLSAFFSSVFRRQLSAIAGAIFVLLFLGVVYGTGLMLDRSTSLLNSFPTYSTSSAFILLGKLSFTRKLDYLFILLLISCPAFLFLSLAVFARGNTGCQSPRRITLIYTLVAIVALGPISLGFSRLAAGVATVDWTPSDSFSLQSVSADGSRILVKAVHKEIVAQEKDYILPKTKWDGNFIVLIDLTENRTRVVEKNRIFPDLDIIPSFPDVRGEKNKILLYEMHRGKLSNMFPDKIVLVDLKNSRKKDIFSEYRSDDKLGREPYTIWSPRGKYFALFKRPPRESSEVGYISIFDSSGNFVGKHILETSGETGFYSNGWDNQSRFYFTQYSEEPTPTSKCMRISPDSMIPEEIPNVPFDNYGIYNISPDGRLLVLGKRRVSGEAWTYGIYDAARETYQPINEDAMWMSYFRWSPDSRTFAYTAPAEPPPGVEAKEGVWFGMLSLYDVETGTGRSVLDEPLRDLSLYTWSPSGNCLLFSHRDLIERRSDTGEPIFVPGGPEIYHVLDVRSGRIHEVYSPFGGYILRWISEDRLIWFDREKLIATKFDGSNPQELFRVEDGKYYLYGKEQG